MTEDRFIDLLNKEIDGLNSPRESEELSAYVRSNPEAHELYQDLLKISTVLSRVEEVEPPHSLRSDILAAVRASRTRSVSGFSVLGWVKELIESRTTFQYAYVFSAGLILGIAIYSMVAVNPSTSTIIDPSSVSGTIILNGAGVTFTTGEEHSFNLEAAAITGSVTTKHSHNLAVVEVDIRSLDAAEIVVRFDPETIRFKGFSQSEPQAGSRTVEKNSFRMTTQGKNSYILAFERLTQHPTEVTVVLTRDQVELYKQPLTIAKP